MRALSCRVRGSLANGGINPGRVRRPVIQLDSFVRDAGATVVSSSPGPLVIEAGVGLHSRPRRTVQRWDNGDSCRSDATCRPPRPASTSAPAAGGGKKRRRGNAGCRSVTLADGSSWCMPMRVTMVKKRLSDGTECQKCRGRHGLFSITRSVVTDRRIVWAHDGDAESPGMH